MAHLSAVEVVAGVRDIARAIEFMHDKVRWIWSHDSHMIRMAHVDEQFCQFIVE